MPGRRRSARTAADAAFELLARLPIRDMVYVVLADRLRTEFYPADDRLRARLGHLPWVRGLTDA